MKRKKQLKAKLKRAIKATEALNHELLFNPPDKEWYRAFVFMNVFTFLRNAENDLRRAKQKIDNMWP